MLAKRAANFYSQFSAQAHCQQAGLVVATAPSPPTAARNPTDQVETSIHFGTYLFCHPSRKDISITVSSMKFIRQNGIPNRLPVEKHSRTFFKILYFPVCTLVLRQRMDALVTAVRRCFRKQSAAKYTAGRIQQIQEPLCQPLHVPILFCRRSFKPL